MLKKLLICMTLVCTVGISLTPQVSFAQNPGIEEPQPTGPRRQMATIIFSGLAGAILGLSTLSFYGRPQDKLNNIAIGFAIGVIAGASFTTYQAATKPYDYLDANLDLLEPQKPVALNKTNMLSYSWEF